jgi:hypothetical protein
MHQAKLTRLSARDQSGDGGRAAWLGRALLLAGIVTAFAISCGPADNQHLLFFSGNELWITSLHGTGVRCLSCGVANDPEISGSADFASPFPDGQRVLIEEDVRRAGHDPARWSSQHAAADTLPWLLPCEAVAGRALRGLFGAPLGRV